MENNEDEPDDVKKATPVESSILDGNKDEKKQSIKGKKPKSAPDTLSEREGSRGKKCDFYRDKVPPRVSKIKNKKPCHPKAEIICRDNLSKDEYIDVLSRPKKSRGSSCKQPKFEPIDSTSKRFASGRKLSCKEKSTLPQPLSRRLEELAKPKPSHIMDLLQTWGSRLRPEIIDSVQKSLEENCTMSPEQMEAYYNETEREDCSRVRHVRRKKCLGEKGKKKSPCDDHIDPQAICEEYGMAQRFMRHIISHLKNCSFAPEDHYDLTEAILSQLGNVLDYRPSGDGDRKFQMMFMLANGIACWVHGLNVRVAEKIAKQQTEDAKEEIEAEGSEEEDSEEEEDGQTEEIAEVTEEEEEEEEEEKQEEEQEEEEKQEEEQEEEEEKQDQGGDEGEVEDEKEEDEVSNEIQEKEEEEPENNEEMGGEQEEDETNYGTENGSNDGNEAAPGHKEGTEETDTDEGTNAEMENEGEEITNEDEGENETTEPLGEPQDFNLGTEISEKEENEKEIEETEETEEEAAPEDDEETTEDIPSTHSILEPGLAIQGLGEGDLFASEIPFITYGRIMEIVVKFLEKFEEAETSEVRRRLQNAIVKKLTSLILAEAPDSLDNNMKAVLEVLAENIAVFMEDTMPTSEVHDVQTMTPVIESTEVRNWGHWLETVMDNATNWGKWIHEKVGEAEEKARTKVTRGDWRDWTSTVNSEALRWRMFNLDTRHRMHREDLNLTHKKVVHRGGKRTENVMGSARLAPAYPEKDETEINAHDLSDESIISDQHGEIIE